MTDPLAIYVHWPFCQSKCPYCDFNSHVSDHIDHEQWLEGYKREIDHIAEQSGKRRITSIFFGGGTPSLMEPSTTEGIINHIAKTWDVDPNIEITLEANPTSIETEKFKNFKATGINRVSIGIQSLHDKDLKFLGRKHSAREGIDAIHIAQKIFDRYSFDLIYARPEQDVSSWEKELKQALTYANGHMSLYQLTIEPSTPFYAQHQRGQFRTPEDDQAGEFYEITQTIMNDAGLPAYEVSNHAQAGQESKHNMSYWLYDDYAGFGPGAHGRLTLNGKKYATRTHRAPDIWLERTHKDGHGYHPLEEINTEDQITERLMMGLRLAQGVPNDKISTIPLKKISTMIEEGFLGQNNTHLYPTTEGLQRLNSVLSYLLT